MAERNFMQRLKDNVMGTKEQNEKAQAEMDKQDKKNPDSTQAKVNRAIDSMTGRKRPEEKPEGYKNGGLVKKKPMAKGYKDGGMVVKIKGKNC
jgi:hypothetical protein